MTLDPNSRDPLTMNNSMRSELVRGLVHSIGEVERCDGERFAVSTPDGIRFAEVAVSCLVVPEIGDSVLVCTHDTRVHVLAVVSRTEPAPLTLRIGTSVNIDIRGNLIVHADESIIMIGNREAQLRAPKIELSGNSVDVNADNLTLAARTCHWLADALESTARVIKQSADFWSVHARTHHRRVDDIELVRAGHVDLKVDEILNVASTHTIMQSRETIRIDGKLIQVG